MRSDSEVRGLRLHHFLWAAACALFLSLEVYDPALRGPFLFDDMGLPFYSRDYADRPLAGWLSGVRPVLMLSYWLNFQLSAYNALSYHLTNIVVHVTNAFLVTAVLRTILGRVQASGKQAWGLGATGGLLFLLHPVQTESVAYIAGRSELLSAMFVLAALLVYFRQPPDRISTRSAAVILASTSAPSRPRSMQRRSPS